MKSVFLVLLFSFPAFATEVVQWENIPLPVTLHVGQERIVDVGKAVRIGYPATLEGKVRLQSAGGKVFCWRIQRSRPPASSCAIPAAAN